MKALSTGLAIKFESVFKMAAVLLSPVGSLTATHHGKPHGKATSFRFV
jgi:hypothetical protein